MTKSKKQKGQKETRPEDSVKQKAGTKQGGDNLNDGDETGNNYGGMPVRDLKTNLGCGG